MWPEPGCPALRSADRQRPGALPGVVGLLVLLGLWGLPGTVAAGDGGTHDGHTSPPAETLQPPAAPGGRPPGLPLAQVELRFGSVQPADGWVVAGERVEVVNLDSETRVLYVSGDGALTLAPGERATLIAPDSGVLSLGLPSSSVRREYAVVSPDAARGEPLVFSTNPPATAQTERRAWSAILDMTFPLIILFIAYATAVALYAGEGRGVAPRVRRDAPVPAADEAIAGRADSLVPEGASPLLAIAPPAWGPPRKPSFDAAACRWCLSQPCLSVCPMGCFTVHSGPRGLVAFDSASCLGCGTCLALCRTGALRVDRPASDSFPSV